MTNVLFLIEKINGELQIPDVFAFFPDDNYSHSKTDGRFTCYTHLGQYSACHIDYANECKEANFSQYRELLRELIGQGYKDLNVLNKQKFEYWRQPNDREIKIGIIDHHYREFTLSEIGITQKGDLKKWIKAKDDGLRYNRF
jgi:hypothetical protein